MRFSFLLLPLLFLGLVIVSCGSNKDTENTDTSYTPTTTTTWTKQLGTSSTDQGFGVTVDSSDNIYVTGETYGGLDGNTNSGGSDLFLVKYNSSGVRQ